MLASIVVIIIGGSMIFPPFIKALLELGNTMRGSKSNITKETIKIYQIIGAVIIVVGIFLIITNPQLR